MAETAVQEYRSASWDDNFVGNYKLQISLAEDGIHYGVVNQISTPMYLRLVDNTHNLTIAEQLRRLGDEDPILKLAYNHIEILLNADPWIPVPDTHILRGKEDMLMQVFFESNTVRDQVYRDRLAGLEASVLFCVPDELEHAAHSVWPRRSKHDFTHIVSPVVQMAMKLHTTTLKNRTSANVELFSDNFIYTICEGGKLRFVNRYKVSGPADVLYFILKVNQTLELDSSQVLTYVTGYSPLRAPVQDLVQKQMKQMYVDSRKLYPTSTHLNEGGFWLDEFSFLLVK